MATSLTTRRSGRRKAEAPDPVDVHVGSRVRLRRNALRISQEKLAETLGVTFQQVQKYERGANRVGASRLYSLARALEVPVPFFYEGLSPTAGSASSGFSEPAAEAFEADPLHRRETAELVGAFYAVDDAVTRRRFVELARSLAAIGEEAPSRRRGRPPKRRS